MPAKVKEQKIRNKEVSWLSFNARLLQEASDPAVPLIERLRFLGIFSSNQDEFFRVRVATLKRLARLEEAKVLIGHDPRKILRRINKTVVEQHQEFERIFAQLIEELEKAGIVLLDETELSPAQAKFVHDYFVRVVRPTLVPLMLDNMDHVELEDGRIYLACELSPRKRGAKRIHTLIQVPTQVLSRFLLLPSGGPKRCIMLLDDVIRFSLIDLFATLQIIRGRAYTVKLTRDAELDIGDDIGESMLHKVSRSLRKREAAAPVRVVYDGTMPDELWRFVRKKLRLTKSDSDQIAGGRYHNFKDFIGFPDVGRNELRYHLRPPLVHKDLVGHASVREVIERRDVLLHYPYQSFDYVIDLLREAAIDPAVTSIEITLYRLARESNVVNALINAARNGKSVTAVVEFQARFDESANIRWADRLQSAGVRVIGGVPGLKVHAKLLLITRVVGEEVQRYASIGTGNFNEETARQYTDHALLTANSSITKDVARVFEFMKNNFRSLRTKHLIVSPFNARSRFSSLVNREIKNVKKGLPGRILVKTNHIADSAITKKLYRAAAAGVEIHLLVRGMFSVVIPPKKVDKDLQATGLIDRYLEHTRLWVFENDGRREYYISSADLMPRNLDRRVEVICPVLDSEVCAELEQYLDYHLRDSVKARLLVGKLKNEYRRPPGARAVRAQKEIYLWLKRVADQSRPAMSAVPKPTASTRRASVKSATDPAGRSAPRRTQKRAAPSTSPSRPAGLSAPSRTQKRAAPSTSPSRPAGPRKKVPAKRNAQRARK